MPAESWQEDGLTHLVFDMREDEEDEADVPPMALFVLDAQSNQLRLVRLIRPDRQTSQLMLENLFLSEEFK